MSLDPRALRARSLYDAASFAREDESDDRDFYATDRFVPHLDRQALATVERIIGTLVVEPAPAILDLMAGWDSHLPASLAPARVVGLGLNENELAQNPRLDQRVIHDLNRDPRLPFPDRSFAVVVNTVSVDYLTRPFEVFAEVGRVLEPGGLFLVLFSNRMFKRKAVRVWRETSEQERPLVVEDFFAGAGAFEAPRSFVSMGLPRPADDRYAELGIPSDPIWAIYAERRGGDAARPPRPAIEPEPVPGPSAELVAERKTALRRTLRCPYCEEPFARLEVPATPFNEWPGEVVYACLNDRCPYLVAGWAVMSAQGTPGFSYRLLYDPDRDACLAVPAPSVAALRTAVAAPRG